MKLYWRIFYFFNPPKTKGEIIIKFCRIKGVDCEDVMMDHVDPKDFMGMPNYEIRDL